jgi:polyisoprenoid-binding protein YceI
MRSKTMVQALSLLLLLAAAAAAELVVYKVDPVHSSVGFSIRHFVSEVDGRFREFEGTIKYDKQNPAASSVQFTIQATSLDTDNPDRDKHLRSPDFFDVQKYPTLSFASTSVAPKDANTLNVTGNFTLRGVTKQLTIPVAVLGTAKTPMGERAGFKTSFTINRMDYGVAWNRALEGGGSILGDDVTISLKVEAVRAAPAPAPK